MEFELGQTYSGYKFLDVAKRSGNGVEYRVQNTFTLRMELLKVLPRSAQDDREETERFMREMRVRAKLVHPNIVTFFTAMPLEGRLVMTTELVEGLPLSERLQLGPIPWREAVDFARQVLAAVDCAHQQQIVHRDISPDNIVVIPGGVLKLTNFRLAKSIHSLHLTQNGAILGCLKYTSPEQVKDSEALDHRSDLYSIGIVLYEMLAGRTPFNSPSQFELMLAHVNQQPEPAGKFNATVPSLLDAVVLRALAKSPSDRYQSAGEFDQALARTVAEMAPAETESIAAPQVAEVAAEVVAEVAAEVVAEEAAEVAPEVEPEPVAAAAVELPPVVEPEPEPEPVAAAAEIAAAIEQEPVAEPVIAEATPEPVAAAAIEPEPPAAATMPLPILLPEIAAHASLWTAAEVVSHAAWAPGAPSFDLPPVFAEFPPVPCETTQPTPAEPVAAAVVAVLSETTAPNAADVSQPAPAASEPTLSPYSVPRFLAAARVQSESIQWAVFGGTAAFLGVIWTAIWLITGK